MKGKLHQIPEKKGHGKRAYVTNPARMEHGSLSVEMPIIPVCCSATKKKRKDVKIFHTQRLHACCTMLLSFNRRKTAGRTETILPWPRERQEIHNVSEETTDATLPHDLSL